MTTVGIHIAAIRGMLNEFSETEVPFSDEYIYYHFRSIAQTYTRQKYDKTNVSNYQNFQFYPVPTVSANLIDCGCVGLCKMLQTKVKVPKMLMTRMGPLMFVRTLDHTDIPYIDMAFVSSLKYDPVKATKMHYSVLDQKIILHNPPDPTRPKAILVGGFTVDVTEWVAVKICDDDGGNETSICDSVLDMPMPIDEELIELIYARTKQQLLNMPISDRTNDGAR